MLIYCSSGFCHHSAVVDADHWPDETALLDLCRKAVCTRCGMIGADVRPNWDERPAGEPDRRTVAAAMKEIVLVRLALDATTGARLPFHGNRQTRSSFRAFFQTESC